MAWCLEDALFGWQAAKRLWKPPLKRYLTGGWSPLSMRPGPPHFPGGLDRLGLYLHVPFCRDLCPYCPYNRVEYDEALSRAFEAALLAEIDLQAAALRRACAGRSMPVVTTLYVGGGTPTVDPATLRRALRRLAEAFGPAREICVELHPSAMDDACLEALRGAGVTMLSVGVETFSDRLLKAIGRSHDGVTAEAAVRRAVAAGFASVNVDLMFSLPGQSAAELDSDLRRLAALEVDQVSTYPMFGFPYTELGRELGLRGIRRPPGTRIREMLDIIAVRCREAGLERCAVWSFLRPGGKKFSSVTRHHYLGFGPSAASMTGRQFRVNTFSVAEYARTLPGRLPVALAMPFDRGLEMAYWLYWRVYEMSIPDGEFHRLFGRDLGEVFGSFLAGMRCLGMARREDGGHRITEAGAYWIHRLQNEYSLNYIDRLWGACRQDPWPDEVRL
ncbi:MAG: radical SAM protein [Elusimicrobia bacterium]|nr:radical SAM protein [Elusimicrobiota bacterium]